MDGEAKSNGQNPELEQAVRDFMAKPDDCLQAQIFQLSERLLRHFVNLYSGESDQDDLYQAACEGLMKALERFDPERGVLFATYASHCILGEIRREIRREKSFYRPAWVIDLQHTILSETERIIKETGQTPSLEEVAKRANIQKEGLGLVMQVGRIPLEDLDRTLVRSQRYVSFQLPIEDKVVLHQGLAALSKVQRDRKSVV